MTHGTRFRAGLWSSTILTILLITSAVGCKKAKEAEPVSAAEQVVAPPQPVLEPTPNALPKAPPATADAALRELVEQLRQNRGEAFWEFMPVSYQNDLNELVRQFARGMDRELWQETIGSARQLVALLRSRKQDVLDYPLWKNTPAIPHAKLASNWDAILGVADWLLRSEFSDLDQLRRFDGREFLSKIDPATLGHLRQLSRLSSPRNLFHILDVLLTGADISLKTTTGDRATVRIEPHGQPGIVHEFGFLRVDRQWTLNGWVREWDEDIEESRDIIETELAPNLLRKKKETMLPQLKAARELMTRLEQAKSPTEFHNLITTNVVPQLLPIAKNMMGPPRAPAVEIDDDDDVPTTKPASPNPGGTTSPAALKSPGTAPDGKSTSVPTDVVRVILRGTTSDQQIESIADQLMAAVITDPRGLVQPSEAVDETVRFAVSPVRDINAFAASLKFGKVTRVDAKSRTVEIEVAPTSAKPSPRK